MEDFKLSSQNEVRARFSPSPTGNLHVGLARTALFNYLFTRKIQGRFILRIEDTDVERSDKSFEIDIIDGLKWLGIDWDEGPDIGGKYGPYRQSERTEIYAKYLEKLLKEGHAYYCFCSEEELEAKRQYQMSIGQPPVYDGKCRNLPPETIKKCLSEGKKSIIRFKVPDKKAVSFEDLIRGEIVFEADLIGDFSIAKDLKSPLYNFAAVIDDFEMKISHVIRGEDHISNTPRQILIQEALGFPHPEYAHLPLILGQDRTKLSKRHGAGSITEYRKLGYLPETIINFIAFLGWNPGTEREIFSLPSLVKEFSLEKVQKGGAIFNVKRLDFLNGFYIRQKSIERLTELCLPFLIEAGFIEKAKNNPGKNPHPGELKLFEEKKPSYKIKETGEAISLDYLEKIVKIYQERLKKLSEIIELADYFFREKLGYNKGLLKWKEMTDKEIKNSLETLEKILSRIKEENWNKENLEISLMPEAEREGDRGEILWPFRVALTGKEASAGPFEIAEILGKEKTLKRIINAHNILCARPSTEVHK